MSGPAYALRRGAHRGAYAALNARGSRRPVALLDLAGDQRHLTSVVRMPVAIATPIVEAVRRLPVADEHYVYPATDLHLTVLNLEHLARSDLAERIASVSAVFAETPSFELTLRGLGMSSQSVYVQAFDDSGALGTLRKRLSRLTGARPPYALRHLGFVNVARYVTPDVERLRQGVDAARRVRFGTVRVMSVEIVRTDKVLSLSGTTLVSDVNLVGAASHELRPRS